MAAQIAAAAELFEADTSDPCRRRRRRPHQRRRPGPAQPFGRPTGHRRMSPHRPTDPPGHRCTCRRRRARAGHLENPAKGPAHSATSDAHRHRPGPHSRGVHLASLRGIRTSSAAADGTRGYVEVRDAGDQVVLTDDTPSLHASTWPKSATWSRCRTHSTPRRWPRPSHHPQLTGITELDYETAKAAAATEAQHAVTRRRPPPIDQHAHDAAERGADYISMRRLSELIGATTLDAYAASAASSRPSTGPLRTIDLPRHCRIWL